MINRFDGHIVLQQLLGLIVGFSDPASLPVRGAIDFTSHMQYAHRACLVGSISFSESRPNTTHSSVSIVWDNPKLWRMLREQYFTIYYLIHESYSAPMGY
jgi:hypothetical protein